MGVGKSHTMQSLHSKGLLDLSTFIIIDPDEIRYQLPEYHAYNVIHPLHACTLTQKEAGYIAELLILASLESGRNVLVDGTLKDWEWYKNYFDQLRELYPNIHIAILHVDAPRNVIVQRVQERGQKMGRIVPLDTLYETLEQVPKSMEKLRHVVDFFCTFTNMPGKDIPEISSGGNNDGIMNWRIFTRYWAKKKGCLQTYALQ